ncbi:FAD-dependent oxidoreductase [Maritalea mobilis]|uniref:flavin monoamine oxidase family protein n=1 Tax=Maritalea mobilis TaxID=483324 RepID=UPI001C95640E|nr:FAD-dependent oxidoreductase [Maritalea mobilis]MBY6201732.1 FAD-dependent oxidoreductase [Maritalea mobilis]
MSTDVVIIGGGLAGLALASRMVKAGLSFQLFEARPHFGGRIAALEGPSGRVDLGPSWFWPGQPRIAQLIAELGLQAFPQHAAGEILFEDTTGKVHRGVGFASMEGSFRVDGGMIGLIEGLVATLPKDRLHLSCAAEMIGNGMVQLSEGRHCSARHVALAIPPRLAAGLRYDPPLPEAAQVALATIPTWMAGHAKFVATYDHPFWRDKGLSGDAMSRNGPLAEIHDASGVEGSPAALFGFVGVPATARKEHAAKIKEMALQQLARFFGPDAAQPKQVRLQDWACEPWTATPADHTPPQGHPDYGLLPSLVGVADGRLHFAATETAPEMGGLMEGALASAERVARIIIEDMGAAATPG